MTTIAAPDFALSAREQELSAIISAYNEVTDKLKGSHERLTGEVVRLREQLEEKNRELARKERLAALGEMAAGVAHEIRNPLAGIQLFSSMLEQDLHEHPEMKKKASRISKGVRTLDGIVNDVLAFAAPGEFELEEISLAPIVDESIALVAPQRQANAAVIHVDMESCDVRLLANAVQLQRALLNLLFNALDAAGPDGEIWVDCILDSQAKLYLLRVADNGPGVPAELRQRIFHPFYTGKDSGTGLGLAIVHRIAECHGGTVRVADRPGGGAMLNLPLKPVSIAPVDKHSMESA